MSALYIHVDSIYIHFEVNNKKSKGHPNYFYYYNYYTCRGCHPYSVVREMSAQTLLFSISSDKAYLQLPKTEMPTNCTYFKLSA